MKLSLLVNSPVEDDASDAVINKIQPKINASNNCIKELLPRIIDTVLRMSHCSPSVIASKGDLMVTKVECSKIVMKVNEEGVKSMNAQLIPSTKSFNVPKMPVQLDGVVTFDLTNPESIVEDFHQWDINNEFMQHSLAVFLRQVLIFLEEVVGWWMEPQVFEVSDIHFEAMDDVFVSKGQGSLMGQSVQSSDVRQKDF